MQKQLRPSCWIRVARFFLVHDTKTGKYVPNEHKIYQMNAKCTKWTLNVPNEHKMYQMNIKCTKWS
jgi:hypothetical protein